MGNRQLNSRELELLQTETELERESIIRAFEKFKRLAGDKGYVNLKDITPFINTIPIYLDVASLLIAR